MCVGKSFGDVGEYMSMIHPNQLIHLGFLQLIANVRS